MMEEVLIVFNRGDTVKYREGIAAWITDTEPGDENPHGFVEICMVGDDRYFWVDPTTLEHVDEDSFCGGCGQIGCGHG